MDADHSSISVYYLRVNLQDAKPPIWRDFLVPSNLTLEDLHYVIQTVMGWENCHLHQFIAEKMLYTEDLNTSTDISEFDTVDRSEKAYTVSQLLPKEKSIMLYEYDLGDSWTHKIELKKILSADTDAHKPRCIKGKRACPPEGCGGIWGYTDMLETLKQEGSCEKDEILISFGEHFNPDYFNIESVNRRLKRLVSLSPQQP